MTAPTKHHATDRLLAYESEFADRLPFIPMAIRRKLDLSGAKISLSQWTTLPLEARRALLLDPVGDTTSAAFWKSLLDSSLRDAGAEESKTIPVNDVPSWDSILEVPAEVLTQASSVGIDIPLRTWASLDELTRFALAKLSRPGHENRNFLSAAHEAGIAP